MMVVLKTLLKLGVQDRIIWLYDTFDGMTEPQKFDGDEANRLWQETQGREWCRAGLDDVKANLSTTGYSSNNITYVQGDVRETIPMHHPESISLLRLDTDWYESTYTELSVLFPKVTQGGIVIIDDYGRWEGCRKATNEYFRKLDRHYFMSRIDSAARLIVKC